MLSIEQWEEVRNTILELNDNFNQIEGDGMKAPTTEDVFKAVLSNLKGLVDTEARRLQLVQLVLQADKLDLEMVRDPEDAPTGELVIYTGLHFPPKTNPNTLQSYDELVMVETEDD